jgi:polyphosphate glucokinase
MSIVGIDIGGTGIKGAPVDVATGRLTQDRFHLETPHPSGVDQIVATVTRIAARFDDAQRFGVTFPGVVVDGVIETAANVDHSWIGTDAGQLFATALGRPVTVMNDADVAGIAEMTFGAGRGRRGVSILLTLGTGIGSAVFLDGRLLPNTELGHLELDGYDAESRASEHAREVEDLSWHHWARRLQKYLKYLERVLRPEVFIIGGGVSNRAEKFLPLIEVRTPLIPAALHNDAGIVGAALAAMPGPGAPA